MGILVTIYACIRANAHTIPAVSVRRTLSQKRTNKKPLSFIFSLSSWDHPPSGPIQILYVSAMGRRETLICSPRVSRVRFFSSLFLEKSIISRKCISGRVMPPHCSTASRTIAMNRFFLFSERISFCEKSDRKKINLEIPTSTHF